MHFQQTLSQAIALTEQSITYAEDQDWDSLEINEQVRQKLVHTLNNAELNVAEENVELVRHQLTRLIESNEALSELCTAERSKLAGDIKTMTIGRVASKAYGE